MSTPVFRSLIKSLPYRWFALALVLSGVLGATQAFAAASASDGGWAEALRAADGDLGSAWLAALFGDALAGNGALASLVGALQTALGAYGMSMFVIGGFFLMWQVVAMITETAQTGVAMGRKGNPLWTPLRFMIGIALLVPIGGGLTIGQSMIVKIAARGSSLATSAWQEAAALVGDQFTAPVSPHRPDMGRVVATAMEMELCRSLYSQAYTALQNDSFVAAAGSMGDYVKIPAQRLGQETWRYTNAFFPDASLCGAFSFLSPQRDLKGGIGDTVAASVAEATRIATERLILQSRAAAERIAPAFATNEEGAASAGDAAAVLAGFVKEQTQLIDAQQKRMEQAFAQAAGSQTSAMAARGWIEAGAFPFAVTRHQIMLGELSAFGAPHVKAPLLGHAVLSAEGWMAAARSYPATAFSDPIEMGRYLSLYHRVSDAMKRARGWLYDEAALAKLGPVLPDQQDLRDALGPFEDSQTAQSALARLVTIGAASYGVLTRSGISEADGAGYSAANAVLPDRGQLGQPLQTVAEMGRRFTDYGAWLTGMLSPALAEPATVGLALCFYLTAFLFWLAGLCLVFAVPFIPLFRFAMAALGWMISVLAAVVFLPLVALGHLYPAGDGLVGPMARRAYWMWLGLFMRPALILLGFVGGLALFVLGVSLLNMLVLDWMMGLAFAPSQAFWVLRAAVSLFYALMVLALANVAFRGISLLPAAVMEWINTHSPLPETLTLANLPTVAQAQGGSSVMAIERSGSGAAVAIGSPSGAALHHKRVTKTGAPTHSDVAARRLQDAQFPHFPELKAAERVEVTAQAFAQAQSGDGPQVEAGAAIITQTGGGDTQSLAMARHRTQGDGVKSGASLEGSARMSDMTLTAPDEGGAASVDAPKPAKPSAKQEAESVAEPNNPFKSGDIEGPKKS